MFKAMILLKRRNDLSAAQFADWWLNQHAPLARQLPGLREARFNLAEGQDNPIADGIAELWFDSEQAFTTAYASPIGQAVAADSLAHVAQRERLLVQEHIVFEKNAHEPD